MNKINPNTLVLFFIIATVPLLSGATQPLVNGLYLFATLLTAGIWLGLHFEKVRTHTFPYRSILVLLILVFIVLTTLNLPIQLVKAISPVRAENLVNALQDGQFINITTSLSYYIPGSRFYAVYGLTLFLFFHFSAALMRSNQNQRIVLWIISLIGGLEAVHGIIQLIFPDAGFLRFPVTVSAADFATGTFSDHNHYAAFLNMCWPISLVLGLTMWKKVFEKMELIQLKNKKISVADRVRLMFDYAAIPFWCTGLIILSVILSGSTTGIVVLLALVILCRMVIPFPTFIKIIFSTTIYAALLLYGWVLGIQGITARFSLLLHSAQAKLSFWSDTLAMLKDHPYSGIGMGAFEFLAPVYVPFHPDNLLLNHAQSDYLELAMELGLPVTLIMFVWLLIGLISYGRRIFKMPHKLEKITRDEIITVGSFYALAGLAINAVAATVLHTQSITLYAVLLLAVLHSTMVRKKTEENYTPEYLFPQNKPVRFIPYKKPVRRRRR